VADDGEAKVVLVEAGAEPRRALRYVYGKNVETVQLDTKLWTSRPPKGVPEPDDFGLQTIRLVMTLTPVSVDATGALTEKCNITHAEVFRDATLNPTAAAATAKDLRALEHIEATNLVTSRGISKSITFSELGDSEFLQALVDVTKDRIGEISAPLPAQPIGVGAKWEVRSFHPMDSAVFTMTKTYVAREISTNRVSVDIEVRGESPPRALPPLASKPPDIEGHLDLMEMHGKGTMTFSLDRLAPTMSVTTTLRTVITVRRRGDQETSETADTVSVSAKPLTPSAAPPP
jgi:hypothetical protein